MKKEKIFNNWGEIWYPTKDELLQLPHHEFHESIYKNRLIIIKSVGHLDPEELYYISDKFGRPWGIPQYEYSREVHETYVHKDQPYVLTRFNNQLIQKIANTHMPWHADIPNHPTKPFPIRILYMNKQPSNYYGKTRWLNIDLDIINLTEQELAYYNDCTVLQQNWLRPNTELQTLSFIKSTPMVEGRKSLRLNYFFNSDKPSTQNAWIKKSFYKNEEIDNRMLIGETIEKLLLKENILYEHTWDVGDMAIYDNWSFIHDRTALKLEPGEIRELLRLNIDHEPANEFNGRKKFVL